MPEVPPFLTTVSTRKNRNLARMAIQLWGWIPKQTTWSLHPWTWTTIATRRLPSCVSPLL